MKRTVLLLLALAYGCPGFGQVGDLLFRDGFDSAASISVLPLPVFPPQLVGSASTPLTLTLTNVGTLPVTLSEIGNTGADAGDFVLDLSGTQFSLAPSANTTLKLTFAPSLPWQPGTRQAQLGVIGDFAGGAAYLGESGQGVTCDGGAPACSSGCADVDGDGLNDVWESAGAIDSDNDGSIDAEHDAALPGADPSIPDVFVQYDWMGYGETQSGCAIDSDCPALWGNAGHAGDTCSGPPVSSFPGSCVHACTTDADCSSREPSASHVGERCVEDRCQHSHDPQLIAPGALDAVVQSFAARGFNLHLVRGGELPHSHVLTYRLLSDAVHPDNAISDACEGGSLNSGTAGPGLYAESFYELKAAAFDPRRAPAFHYAIFAHYNTCDSGGHCSACPAPTIALNPDGSPKLATPAFGLSGLAELEGNDFVVSLGPDINDTGTPPTVTSVGGTFMHELGHNLGLHHGGGSSVSGDAEDAPTHKPNYLSVMNLLYQKSGLVSASAVGTLDPPYSVRLDYSTQTLPSGGNTPGSLDEDDLDEAAGLGSGNADIILFDSYQAALEACPTGVPAPADGPVDWDGDGITGDNAHAGVDLNRADHPGQPCPSSVRQILKGHTDWGPAPGQSVFVYGFRCRSPGRD